MACGAISWWPVVLDALLVLCVQAQAELQSVNDAHASQVEGLCSAHATQMDALLSAHAEESARALQEHQLVLADEVARHAAELEQHRQSHRQVSEGS